MTPPGEMFNFGSRYRYSPKGNRASYGGSLYVMNQPPIPCSSRNLPTKIARVLQIIFASTLAIEVRLRDRFRRKFICVLGRDIHSRNQFLLETREHLSFAILRMFELKNIITYSIVLGKCFS